MSVEATTAAWARRGVSPTEKLVLVRIADHASPDGRDAWPSIPRLALDTELSERAVRKAIRSLESKGALACERATGPHGTNRYTVVLDSSPRNVVPPERGSPRHQVPPPPERGAPPPRNVVPPNRPLNHPEPSTSRADAAFADFYELYPRHVARRAAEKAYKAALKRASAEEILAGLERACAAWEANSTATKYIPHPATWLNGDCWADVLDAGPSNGFVDSSAYGASAE